MSELFLRRGTDGGLWPDDEESKAVIDAIPAGELLRAETTRPRNPRFHRLFFGLISLVFKNTTRYKSPEVLREIVTIGAGHCDISIIKVDGQVFVHHVARSIAWSKMEEDEFRQFWNRAVDYIIAEILPGAGRASLEHEVFLMLGFDLDTRDRP